jgi:hypothetical protein
VIYNICEKFQIKASDSHTKFYQSLRTKGVVCGPVDKHLADACPVTEYRKCHVLLPSLMQACPRYGLWVMCIRLSIMCIRLMCISLMYIMYNV